MIKRLMIVIIGLFLVATPAFALDVSDMNTYASRYYAMEESSGNLVDATGNQNAVAGSSITYGVTGKIDDAIQFSDTDANSYIEVEGYPTNANGVWSSCQWVYVTGSKQWQNVFRADQVGTYRNVALQRTANSAPPYSDSWRYVFSSGFDAVGGTVNYNQWDHICTTNDGSTAKLYQNGVQVASDSVSSQAVTWNYELVYGIRPDTGSERFTGSIDEVVNFNGYTLNLTEVQFLYALGSPDSRQQYTFTQAAPNTNPTITAIADQQTNEDEPIPIVPNAFTIGDAEDGIGSLTLSYTSSDTALINSTGSITFVVNSTTGEVEMQNITPNANAFGTSTINVTVTDTGALTNSTQFLLTVFSVNDVPTITPIANQTMQQGSTIVIDFNVTDVDNPYTDLSYGTNSLPIDFTGTFSEYDGTNQTFTLSVAANAFGEQLVNITVSDPAPAQASSPFYVSVICNTSKLSLQSPGYGEPADGCFEYDLGYDPATKVIFFEYHDFMNTVDEVKMIVYRTTAGNKDIFSINTTTGVSGNLTYDYNAYANDDFLVVGMLKDGNRTFVTTDSDGFVTIDELSVVNTANFSALFEDNDSIVYSVLILLLFITIGVASQSASLTLLLMLLGLIIAGKFVYKVPTTTIYIIAALVFILLGIIARLRND